MTRPLFVAALVGIFTAPSLYSAPATEPVPLDPVRSAWQKATLHLFKEAYQEVHDADSPEARVARAALLLLQQPKTAANLDDATARLEPLAAISPAGETAITARYLLARIVHVHRDPIDLAAAAGHYRLLLDEHPSHFLADQALIKLAMIEIHAPRLTREERLARIDHYGERAGSLARAGSRRDLHLFLANACANLRLDEERGLRHFLAADLAGVESPLLRANVTVAVGELARRRAQPDLARKYFERFLAEFQRDYRRAFVTDKLAALPTRTPGLSAALPSPAR